MPRAILLRLGDAATLPVPACHAHCPTPLVQPCKCCHHLPLESHRRLTCSATSSGWSSRANCPRSPHQPRAGSRRRPGASRAQQVGETLCGSGCFISFRVSQTFSRCPSCDMSAKLLPPSSSLLSLHPPRLPAGQAAGRGKGFTSSEAQYEVQPGLPADLPEGCCFMAMLLGGAVEHSDRA